MEIPRQRFSNGMALGELCKTAFALSIMFPKNGSTAPGTAVYA
jgi:hypothetical protein